jgi:hypothetical protein
MRRFRRAAVAFLTFFLLAPAGPALAGGVFPEVIDLPSGFFPEGIAVGRGSTLYAGSLTDGSIWRGNARTGDGSVLVEGTPGTLAVGLDFDESGGNLWVSGGPGGDVRVYDGVTGELVDSAFLGAGFINDVVVTGDAAYLTNSFVSEIYSVPLAPDGSIDGPVVTLPLTGDFAAVPGQFNANGVEATPDGSQLIVVSATVGEIYTVDPTTGVASLIDLDGAVVNGDGLALAGRTLYAVEGGKNQVTEIRLAPDLASGAVVGALTTPAYDVPTTAAIFGSTVYVVNAKFTTPPTPTTPYEIVGVAR